MMWSKGDQNSKNSFFENEHRSKVWNSGRRDSSKKRKVFHFQHQIHSVLQRRDRIYCWRRSGWSPVMHRRCHWGCRHHFGFWSQNAFWFWEHHPLHPSPPSSEMRISLRDGGFIRRNLTQISILQAWYILTHASTKGTLFDVRPGRDISMLISAWRRRFHGAREIENDSALCIRGQRIKLFAAQLCKWYAAAQQKVGAMFN